MVSSLRIPRLEVLPPAERGRERMVVAIRNGSGVAMEVFVCTKLDDDTYEWVDLLEAGASSAVWGAITGTLADQTDLVAELASYSLATHQHPGAGTGSVALGPSTTAAGANAVGIGDTAVSSAQQTVAIGRGAQATANDAIAIGDSASSTGLNAVAIGDTSSAANTDAVAIGVLTVASAAYSTAVGPNSDATSVYSVAIGGFAQATGAATLAIGSSTAAGDYSFSIGVNSIVPSTSPRSMALGYGAIVSASTPDTAVIKVNDVQIERSNGTGVTRLGLLSPDGTVGWLTVSDTDGLTVNSNAMVDTGSSQTLINKEIALSSISVAVEATMGTFTTMTDDEYVIVTDTNPYLGKMTWAVFKSQLKSYFDTVYTDAEGVRDAMGTALEAPSGSGMTVEPDDAGDKILLYARTPPYKELMAPSGTRDFGPATHGLGVVYNSIESMTANVLYFIPIYFEGSETITQVSINVQVAGAAGAAIRTGLFTGSDPSGSTPAGRSLQTLVADWGTQAATTTGTKNWTVSTAVTRGWYWFGMVCNDNAVTTHTIASPQGYEQPSVQGKPNNCHFKISHGAGPAAFAATETPFAGNNQHPAFTFRVS